MPTVPLYPTLGGAAVSGEVVCPFGEAVAEEIHDLWTPGLQNQSDERWNLPAVFAGFRDPSRHRRLCVTVDGLPVGFLVLTTTVQFRGSRFDAKAVLIEYLSVAPWCRSRKVCQDARHPRVEGVAPMLLALAARISLQIGHEGAFCLFSEEASDGWYQKFFDREGIAWERLPAESDGSGFYPYFEVHGPAGAALADRYGVPSILDL